ncbi:hypothetical protein [Pseudomonas syringae group sp. J309-1]|uniref:hypothetical protein n=1 Tax=Pseudomonas syringae group sp. J309-1 TaxID=3079588 RepID=UPI00290E5EBE|nr:hypothetical protein [Pseudomonas syringae group sp. J309-1]MDU8358026.1 hypothetical protein [Pseudomonas syringae group sp. J309-1]
MSNREAFEQAYAEDNNCDLEWCQTQRMKNGSYLDRYMAKAWYGWQRAKEAA